MKKKILIIDDSEDTREFMKLALEMTGYEVIQAEDGSEGLKKTRTEPFDLIIMDLSMPGIDGFSLTQQIRKSKFTENTPIIVSTAHGELKNLFQVNEKTNIQGFIEKPFLPEELIDKVKKLLSKK